MRSKHRPQSRPEARQALGGVNLGSLYLPVRAIDESPQFRQRGNDRAFRDPLTEPLHAAIVVIKNPQDLSNATLRAVGLTLSQLSRLGLTCAVLLDSGRLSSSRDVAEAEHDWLRDARKQATRVMTAIEQNDAPARHFDAAFGLNDFSHKDPRPVIAQGRARLLSRSLMTRSMAKHIIPVILPISLTESQTLMRISMSESLLALTREFAGLNQHHESQKGAGPHVPERNPISLDRIIILDRNGGLPSSSSLRNSHVFVNLEQEYNDIRRELAHMRESTSGLAHNAETLGHQRERAPGTPPSDSAAVAAEHLSNLQLTRDALALLPPSASALLTDPETVARSHNHRHENTRAFMAPGVATRPQRNVLIHNLLTDKPVFSSSLPRGRLSASSTTTPSSASAPTTFIKRGLPLTILPDARHEPWSPPSTVPPIFTLPAPSSASPPPPIPATPPGLDIPRLVHLIDDSFGRPLAAAHYLARVLPRLAGVVVAGAYEGAAVCTWELPPHVPADQPGARAHLVPYLDKFAVLRRAQGTGGVADVVFSAMVRRGFPGGVCWRSRSGNPVNKWYFERAAGSWRLPPREGEREGWTMFWTTENVDGERFHDYEAVCRSIGTSWADGETRLD